MSHITTTLHARGMGFDALQSTAPNGDLGDCENRYDCSDNASREHEQGYHRRRYNSQVQASREDETLLEHENDRHWSTATSESGRVSTGYKPDMITDNEAIMSTAPVMDRKRPNYKPSALRWPFLIFILVIILALVGLMTWARHALPVLDNNMDTLTKGLLTREVVADRGPNSDADRNLMFTPASLTARANTSSDPDTEPTMPMTPGGGDFAHVGGQTVSETPGSSTTTAPHWVTTSIIGTIAVDSKSQPAWTRPQSNYGSAGEDTITSGQTASDRPLSDYGNAGTEEVSEASSYFETSDYGNIGRVTVSETEPQTPTSAGSDFIITSTLAVTPTSTPAPIPTPKTTTPTDSPGRVATTREKTVPVMPSVTNQTNSSGIPTATATLHSVVPPSKVGSDSNESSSNVVTKTYFISLGDYVVGMFLPTLLAIILAIPIRILDLNAKILQPWHGLTRDRGASGRESLCLDTSGWQSVIASFRSLAGGEALVFLTSVLVLASALLIPLSAEAISFDLRGIGCAHGSMSAHNCAYVLSVFRQAADATLAVLAVMGVAVFLILVILVRWRSGVSTNPWSMCGIASLSMNSDVRRLFTSVPAGVDMAKMPKGLLRSILQDRRFKLGYFYGPDGTVEYGIMLHDEHGDRYARDHIFGEVKELQDHHVAATKSNHHLPFLMLGYAGRCIFQFVLCGLLALILYYHNTSGDTPFERFMDSESFGVRFLFTGVGVIISFFWASLFRSIAILGPYQLLAKSPQHARRSILLAPPTNAFSGLSSAVRRRHGFLAAVALTSILSEFLAVFLGNVPFRVTQTLLVHSVCMWAAVGILCVMVLVVAASFFVAWPHMPVDPSTVAGAVYYVCDSWMLGCLEGGLGAMGRKSRDGRVDELGLRYEFGEIRGASGIVRVGVDVSPSSGSGDWAL
ncbi:hypothetical protein GGR53DRAFT_75303 [Hypoxylon sp. FL1150]|nr:hypothetical protein GGR53DRAFT_75303 [Hypoxylon sp. FL1150]